MPRTEMIPTEETTQDNSILIKSSQHVILNSSELKASLKVSDHSDFASETNTNRTEEPPETLNISASTFPAVYQIPSSVSTSVINHPTNEENSDAQSFHADEGNLEELLGPTSSHSEGMRENSHFKTEASPSEILHNDLFCRAAKW